MAMNRDQIVDLGHAAADRLQRLKNDPDFVARYKRGEPDHVDAFREMTRRVAEGRGVALADITGRENALAEQRLGIKIQPDPNINYEAAQALAQTRASMQNPEFANRLAKGDPAAVREWRAFNDGLAYVNGISAEENRGPAPAAVEQPASGSVGAVTSGGTAP